MRQLIARSLLLISFVFVAPMASADVLDSILERGTIRVGVAEFAPWTLRDPDGRLIGFEVDLARKIAADMGVTADFKVYEWEEIVAALQRGDIDIIAGGMAITPAGALQVNFSRPVASSGISIATNTGKTRSIDSMQQLNTESVVVVVVAETLAANVAATFFDEATIKTYASSEDAERDVVAGRAHAYVASLPEVNFLAMKNPGVVDLPMANPLVASSEGLAVKKGEQEMLNFLNAWVTAHHADRWLESTWDYWFKSMSWMPGNEE